MVGRTDRPTDRGESDMDENKMLQAIERRRELADRNVGNVVTLLERRQELRGIYPMADLLADNVGWLV